MKFLLWSVFILAVAVLTSLILSTAAVGGVKDVRTDLIKLDARLADVEKKVAATQPPGAVRSLLPTFTDQLALATGGSGEGVIHPFTRQLVADPTLITDPKEQYKGDRADKKALKRWAGRQAFLIATKFGYIDWKFGAEIRIRRPGETAFLLSKDAAGRLHVAEYTTSTPDKGFGVSPSPTRDRLLAGSVSQSQFLGWPDNQKDIPAYEYLYAG